MAIPPAMLDELRINTESVLDLSIDNGALVMKPARKRYRLEELLAQCDPDAPLSEAEREWMEAPSIGLEVLPEDDFRGPES